MASIWEPNAGTNETWGIWTSDSTTSTTCASTDATWSSWNNTASTSTARMIWEAWLQADVEAYRNAARAGLDVFRNDRNADVAAEVAAEARRQARAKDRLEREAKQRAEELLLGQLTHEQAESFAKDRRFAVIGSDGERYEIEADRQHENIFRLDEEGNRVERFCIYAKGAVPMGDNALAQKLMLETDVDKMIAACDLLRPIESRNFFREVASIDG